jgi:hypothetical protein
MVENENKKFDFFWNMERTSQGSMLRFLKLFRRKKLTSLNIFIAISVEENDPNIGV